MCCPASLRLSIASSRTAFSSAMPEVYGHASSDHSVVCLLLHTRLRGSAQEESWISNGLQYLPKYVDEFVFHYNHRYDPGGMFNAFLGRVEKDSPAS